MRKQEQNGRKKRGATLWTTSQSCCCSRWVAKSQLEKPQLHLAVENLAEQEIQWPRGILVAMAKDAGAKLAYAPPWMWEISQCPL